MDRHLVEHGERLRSNGFEESAVRGIKLLHRRRRQTGANTPAGPDTALPRLPRELQSHLHDVQGPQISRFVAEPLYLTDPGKLSAMNAACGPYWMS